MGAKNWILGTAAATAVVMACVGAGCGGSSDNGPAAVDAGQDVTVDHSAPDTSPDTAPDSMMDAGMMCAVDADITMLHLDAGPDGGACISCVQTRCTAEIAMCNADCTCKSAFIDFLNCTGMGGAIMTCGTQTLSGLPLPTILAFVQCATPCAGTCGVSLDGGRDGATDAPADAPGG